MPFQIKVKGIDALAKNLRGLASEYPKLVRRSLYKRSEFVMTDSKQHYVPVKDGVLRASGHVISADPPAIKMTLGFGGPAGIGNVGETNREDVGYAVIQHENLDYDPHKIGESKFLEKPLMKVVPTLAKDVASDVNFEKTADEPETSPFVKRK